MKPNIFQNDYILISFSDIYHRVFKLEWLEAPNIYPKRDTILCYGQKSQTLILYPIEEAWDLLDKGLKIKVKKIEVFLKRNKIKKNKQLSTIF